MDFFEISPPETAKVTLLSVNETPTMSFQMYTNFLEYIWYDTPFYFGLEVYGKS